MKKSILITLLTILPLLAMAQFGQVRGTNASNSNGNYVGEPILMLQALALDCC